MDGTVAATRELLQALSVKRPSCVWWWSTTAIAVVMIRSIVMRGSEGSLEASGCETGGSGGVVVADGSTAEGSAGRGAIPRCATRGRISLSLSDYPNLHNELRYTKGGTCRVPSRSAKWTFSPRDPSMGIVYHLRWQGIASFRGHWKVLFSSDGRHHPWQTRWQ